MPNLLITSTNSFQRFILNGLAHVNKIFNEEVFQLKEWRVIGEYVYDDEGGRHQAFLSPIRGTNVLGSAVQPHERILIEQSLKYSKAEYSRLWSMAGFTEVDGWCRGDEYGRSATPTMAEATPHAHQRHMS